MVLVCLVDEHFVATLDGLFTQFRYCGLSGDLRIKQQSLENGRIGKNVFVYILVKMNIRCYISSRCTLQLFYGDILPTVNPTLS